jgi:hypothetical protein
VQANKVNNIFNKIIAENFPSLKKVLPIQVQETSRTQPYLTKIEPLYGILSSKQLTQRTEKEY